MRLRMSGVFLFVMALMSSCSTGSKSTDLNLDSVVETATSPAAPTPEVTPVPPTAAPTPASNQVQSSTDVTTTSLIVNSTDLATTVAAVVEPDSTLAVVALPAEDRVRLDFERARVARQDCGYFPDMCAFGAIALNDSPIDRATRQLMTFRLSNNLRAVAGKGESKDRIDGVTLRGDSAFVTDCTYDTIVVFDVADPTNPDDDIIYNEEKNSYQTVWEMRLDGGIWLLYGGADLQSQKDGDLCGF
jgi:hypothetical protein